MSGIRGLNSFYKTKERCPDAPEVPATMSVVKGEREQFLVTEHVCRARWDRRDPLMVCRCTPDLSWRNVVRDLSSIHNCPIS